LRGLFGAIVLLILLSGIVTLEAAATQQARSHALLQARQAALVRASETTRNTEDILRKALGRAAALYAAGRREEAAALVAEAESFIEEDELEIDAWVGVLEEGEEQRMTKEMLETNETVKCRACLDLATPTKGYDEDTVAAIAVAWHYNASARLSRNALSRAPLLAKAFGFGKLAAGCSVLDREGGIAQTCAITDGELLQ